MFGPLSILPADASSFTKPHAGEDETDPGAAAYGSQPKEECEGEEDEDEWLGFGNGYDSEGDSSPNSDSSTSVDSRVDSREEGLSSPSIIGADILEASSHRFRDRSTTLQNVDGPDLEQRSDRNSRTVSWLKSSRTRSTCFVAHAITSSL